MILICKNKYLTLISTDNQSLQIPIIKMLSSLLPPISNKSLDPMILP